MDIAQEKIRWRLILGEEAEESCGGLGGLDGARDAALEYLYGREGQGRNRRGGGRGQRSGQSHGQGHSQGPSQNKRSGRDDSKGSLDASQLTVPEWINAVHTLFPKRTIERIEKDALERYQLTELVTHPELLRRAEPSMTLLKAVLHTKHLMNQELLAIARELVRRVVEQLMASLARPVRSAFLGAMDRRRRSNFRVAKNFDAQTTLRRNLKHYDLKRRQIFIQTPQFFSRVRRHTDRWQIIILVDQSGSMAGSVVHSSVTASIFFGIQALRTHLVLFDTSIVDVTADCSDPVETLMKVQLGGGTDIGQAVRYAESLIDNPRRSLVVLITDFCEGAPVPLLLEACRHLIEQGTQLLGLAALDEGAEPRYDHDTARQIVALGAHVGAMTPGELALWVAEKVR